MREDEVIGAVHDAALEYIYSVVPQKRIVDVEVLVGIDGSDVAIDVRLATDRGEAVDRATAEEAVRVAARKADELMAG